MHLLSLLLLLLITTSSAAASCSIADTANIRRWCSTTPHPSPCRYFLTNHPNPPRDEATFYRLTVQVSFDLALRAQSHLKPLRRLCHNSRLRRSAWLDCWRLYASTLLQLNRTLSSSCTAPDAQTWLSAALTNLDTCHAGFDSSPSIIRPVISRYNLTDLISNSLAINSPNASSSYVAPSWTPAVGRRLLQISSSTADFVVSRTGRGGFQTIKAALDAAAAMRKRETRRIVVYVKAGVYRENIQIVNSLDNITFIGDGIRKTIVTGSRSVANGYTTFSSPTFSVFGDGFIAVGITFRNTYGYGAQAVALLSGSDRSVFYRCSFEGYQDTLCVFSQRQFYRECDIYGTIDFIFGNAAAVLQSCNIYVRRPAHGEANAITAQGRIDPNQNTGIVIQTSAVRPTADLRAVTRSVKSYLGRPWKPYSRVVYMQSYISGIIDPAGWTPFDRDNVGLNTLHYAEFRNSGRGARMSRRVKWQGYHAAARPSEVRDFTVSRFINGRAWLPSVGVPFTLTF